MELTKMKLTKMQKRMLIFFIGCIGARLLFVYLAFKLPLFWLKIMGMIAIIISMGFLMTFIFDLRNTGIMGDKVWWNSLRPFHSVTYLIFGILAIKGIQNEAWKILLLDVSVGLGAFLIHYFVHP
jgi:hypothetical protein